MLLDLSQGISWCPRSTGSLPHASIRLQVPTVLGRLDKSDPKAAEAGRKMQLEI